jgi:predicted phosphodiesterase
MRYLIVTDMHGNWEAMEAVLRAMRRKRFDAFLVLGDLVGYGAAPNQIVDAVRRMAPRLHVVRGNHDKVVARLESGEGFNPAAAAAARWTNDRLTATNLAYVRDLPEGPLEVEPGVAICHGSPLDEDQYLFSDFDAFQVFARFPVPVTFFGHTHVPSLFRQNGKRIEVKRLRGETGRIQLDGSSRYLLNPGSVGQPRDRDPRAACMTFDSDRGVIRWYRIAYPIERAQKRIRRAGLPAVLADRLKVGM